MLGNMPTDKVKSEVKSAEHYRKVTREWDKKEIQFHKLKSHQIFTVILNGLYHSTEINEIKQNLEQTTQNPLSMFYICITEI